MEILTTKDFGKRAKHLSKKYSSFKHDLSDFVVDLANNPEQGVLLANGFRKIRMSITSKGKGKSGGARVITLNCIVNMSVERIILVTIYDKSERETINDKDINEALNTL